MLIAIEGNIGVGKTTLASDLSKRLGFELVNEPVTDNPYLVDYYKNPRRYAAIMQYWLLTKRSKSHFDIINKIWDTGCGAIVDRTIYGDSAFAYANYVTGNMDGREHESYLLHYNLMVEWLKYPHALVYLDAKPEVCMQRIYSRGRGCEATIQLEYLEFINRGYKVVLEELKDDGCNVIIIDWNNFQSIESVIETILSNKRCQLFWNGFDRFRDSPLFDK